MRLSNIREGDIVQVNDGLPYLAHVREREPRRLHVAPVSGHFNPRPIKPREVVGHWRRVK